VSSRIAVKRIRQVPTEYWALAKINQLPNAEGATEHAEIRVHAKDEDVEDPSFLQEIENLLATIANCVFGRDPDQGSLAAPWIGGIRRATRRIGVARA
jgi:hypothetical protein